MDYSVILSDVFSSDLDGIIAHLMTRAGAKTAFRTGCELSGRWKSAKVLSLGSW